MKHATRPVGPLVCLVLMLGACADAGADGAPPDPCENRSVESLEGEWSVTATGTRRGCDGSRYEGDIDLMVEPFIVYVTTEAARPPSQVDAGTEADAFLARVRTAPVLLRAAISDDNVEFYGGGSGCALYFSIRETLSGQSVLGYDFEGTMQDVDRAGGTFTGFGPGKCTSQGQFTVARR